MDANSHASQGISQAQYAELLNLIAMLQGRVGNAVGPLNKATIFNTATSAPSPATVPASAAYTPNAHASRVLVGCSFSGSAGAPTTLTAQIVGESGPLSSPINVVTDGAGNFGGTIVALDNAGPARTYELVLTSADHTFSVPGGSAFWTLTDVR